MVLLFRAGPNFNHHHADQGSLLLSAFGEVLIGEAGWSDYYKDPYYATFFTQAIGHNTILVGGNPESQTIPDTLQFKALNRYPRITDRTLFSSTSPVSIASHTRPTELAVVCNANTAAKLTLLIGNKPARILLDGKELRPTDFSFDTNAKTVSLDIPRGRHDLKIVFR